LGPPHRWPRPSPRRGASCAGHVAGDRQPASTRHPGRLHRGSRCSSSDEARRRPGCCGGRDRSPGLRGPGPRPRGGRRRGAASEPWFTRFGTPAMGQAEPRSPSCSPRTIGPRCCRRY
jgi:hypothetical protein